MKYVSTRGASAEVGLSEALLQGLAPDGGLFVPRAWPEVDVAGLRLAGAGNGGASWAEFAARFLTPFATGDELSAALGEIADDAFDFPLRLLPSEPGAPAILELFHGPTAAFKDFGARFLAAAIERLRREATGPLRILVATSGDTGGAVASAFHRRPGIAVTVLYPKGLVSPTQERQLTVWGDNVQALAVRGTFDDCQRLVKSAFEDPSLRAAGELSTANSINLGRLLPQAAYWGWASLELERIHAAPPSFVVPSGNLGNVLACLWARRIGFPIRHVVLAHNANRAVPDLLESGQYRARPSLATLASAMDVGDPSNLERLRALYSDMDALRGALLADSVDDDSIRTRIRSDFVEHGRILCPHTACASEAWARLPTAVRKSGPWALAATAHPAKFPETLEPLIGRPVEVPEALARLFERPAQSDEIGATPQELRARLLDG